MIFPKSPKPIIRSDHPDLRTYESDDIISLRLFVPELKSLTDDEIACYWTYFCVEAISAGWVGCTDGSYIDFFINYMESLKPEELESVWSYC